MSEIDVLLHDVNKNREDGKVLFATIDGVMSANLAEFITQPADGILYDLNRDEVTTASFGITTRTINDLAVATVIRYLRAELARRDEELALTEKKLCNIDRSARAEVARRDDLIKRLVEILPTLKISHHYCEDCWYSCPKHEDGCCNDAEGEDCNCGADTHNAKIDALMKELE